MVAPIHWCSKTHVDICRHGEVSGQPCSHFLDIMCPVVTRHNRQVQPSTIAEPDSPVRLARVLVASQIEYVSSSYSISFSMIFAVLCSVTTQQFFNSFCPGKYVRVIKVFFFCSRDTSHQTIKYSKIFCSLPGTSTLLFHACYFIN